MISNPSAADLLYFGKGQTLQTCRWVLTHLQQGTVENLVKMFSIIFNNNTFIYRVFILCLDGVQSCLLQIFCMWEMVNFWIITHCNVSKKGRLLLISPGGIRDTDNGSSTYLGIFLVALWMVGAYVVLWFWAGMKPWSERIFFILLTIKRS